MSVVICVPIQDIEDTLAALRIRLPGLGALQALREALDKLPSPSQAVGQFMSMIDSALQPLRQIISVMEMLLAIINCLEAVYDAVSELSPDPIVDCINNLSTIISRLAEYIPPVPYMRAIADICLVMIRYCDEILRTLQDIDG